MKTAPQIRILFPRQFALVLLASAIAMPALAQSGSYPASSQNNPSATVQQQFSPTDTDATAEQQPPAAMQPSPVLNTPKEGFWGRVNPFARKKWVNARVEPIKGQLNELDEVNAKNRRDIRDVDSRSQAGIRHAQSTADAANQTATAAGEQARNANGLAQGAAGHVDKLNSTVSGIDQYKQAGEVDVAFRGGQATLSAAARKQLDDFAANLTGHQGYVLEIEGHSPLKSTAGIQSSARLTDSVKRYLVEEHQIPIYRLHTVALGNAPTATADSEDAQRVRASSVHIRLMENSLAAQESASPQSSASLTGAERP